MSEQEDNAQKALATLRERLLDLTRKNRLINFRRTIGSSLQAIQTLFYPAELETRLKTLRQKANSAIEEMGTNILYLALGFLEWYDDSTDKPCLAPLFLLPVRLHKGRLNTQTGIYPYTIRYSGEDIMPNLSLREKLRVDFSLALPNLASQLTREFYESS